ncbi:type IV secretory system conjugative DNA transfer family protein [Rhodococcus sp. BP-316]|uniref:type IV secretory system conjugative DNA transfer family protein n=1 Tax=Rhodococcus sp. BP-316 TaxID=2739445 RepID=UPI001C9AC58B|nr:TraM recognition domain-containing protein [Rhodococcus sp. BP-316]MBY6681868.1 type IV secretory system conjugative DNA transfer family protein [Rhodococcus sp. BP-316]
MSTGRGAKNPNAGVDPMLALTGGAIVISALVYGGAEAALHLGGPLSGIDQYVPGSPFALVTALANGSLVWPVGATIIAAAFGILALVVIVAGTVRAMKRRRRVTRVDDAGRFLGRPREVARLGEKALRTEIARLGDPVAADQPVAAPLGRLVLGPNRFGITLYAGPEDVATHIWGPRMGKTSCVIIPQLLAARGAVLTTSNKRDVVDTTRAYRAEKGPVWVFDPQGVAQELPRWFYDPLTWVRSARPSTTQGITDTTASDGRRAELAELLGENVVATMSQSAQETKAATLAGIFATSLTGENTKREPFFDPMGQRLVTGFLLAAALERLPLPIVYTWATTPENQEPVRLLRGHGFGQWAESMIAQYNAPDKQRGGVFATAANMLGALAYAEIHPWISRMGEHDTRPEFDPAKFAAEDAPTLFCLSMEDAANECGALVTALTVAVTDALVDRATATPAEGSLPAGRLRVPATYALDEAANVVRWRQLPNLYSHFGSRGITVTTILQSWSQGEECFGQGGMKKLWGASTIRVYGGGGSTDDGRFLENTSAALGDHWEMSQTVSTNSSGRSSSQQRQKIRTLPADALEAMPAGRAILRAAKCPPALIETMPWYTGPFAAAVADARTRAGQDPAVHPSADDPDPTDATSLLPSPTKHPVAAPRSGAVTVS